MAVRPLTVALVAALLLVISVGADVAMNRAYALDLQQDGGWIELARQPFRYDDHEPPVLHRETLVEANRTDAIAFRLRVDNGLPWDFSDTYRVYVAGREVASGTLAASAFSEGEATFAVEADTLMSESGFGPADPEKKQFFPSVEVRVGDETLYASFGLREVSR